MTKLRAIILSLVFLFVESSFAHDHNLTGSGEGTELQGNFRFFYKKEKLNYLAELTLRNEVKLDDEESRRFYKSLRLGVNYRWFKNLKVGLYYLAQLGARHDEDWTTNASTDWFWQNSNSRLENVFIFSLTPRVQLKFLPGRWVAELKARLAFNTFNSNLTLKTRPGLTYFWFMNQKPFLNLSVQYDLYIPLNFSEATFYEKWLYLSVLYHWSPRFQVGMFYSHRTIEWTSTDEILAAFVAQGESATPYYFEVHSHVIGLVALFRFGD